ncbi:MAG TPA: OsmC family protein [Gemmatimonadaceae bacterium]|jgi:organic hydroperoxide reductase OsmC/OhrA|nr:OsmC family protein [Gemmatimonadaceae bacterium]
MSGKTHEYAARLTWEDSGGEGTTSYERYGRQYRVRIGGKPDLVGSADAMFRGDAALPNPEDLFLVALSSCHMLSYLALCARSGVRVLAYEDDARATLQFDGKGGGRFVEVMLHPRVTIAADSDLALARQLHEPAHETCYVASSCSVPVRHRVTVTTA